MIHCICCRYKEPIPSNLKPLDEKKLVEFLHGHLKIADRKHTLIGEAKYLSKAICNYFGVREVTSEEIRKIFLEKYKFNLKYQKEKTIKFVFSVDELVNAIHDLITKGE